MPQEFKKIDEENQVSRMTPEEERRLEAYIEAFIGTEQESIPAFEKAGVKSWLKADPSQKR
ncbi:MAG: hypothetical protein Q7S58_16115 [Candidatus Binatus sp.]|uniref:hypothetical protein n=1 Tax=Candidatus Binatus sp. TaxID=2811406 RepID=UPI00272542D0|nr:hypothetical protein [Candidatus Binatus sp.]MDO8433924.1 hypothetical protein [Candidatus Binatus sp.]